MSPAPRAGDYFCGAGGSSLGIAQAGYEVVGYDNWQLAVDTHNANGHKAICHDLSDPAGDDDIEPAELVWISCPCQPFSAAGLKTGQGDLRDGFPWALRIVAAKRPAVVVFENVKGLTYRRHAEYLRTILTALRGMGYVAEQRVLNCADYGVPQTRERCIIIARRDGGPIVWPPPTHSRDGNPRWVSMADALGWHEGVVGFPRQDDGNATVVLNGARYRARNLFPTDGPAQAITEKGRSWSRWLVRRGYTHSARRSPDEPAQTIVNGKGPSDWIWVDESGDQHDAVRVELHELAVLQGFPPDYSFHGNRTLIARQIGNAVPPTLARVLVAANRPIRSTAMNDELFHAGPGEDFQRHPSTTAPYVNSPTLTTLKGRPARVMYGRPSNFGSQIEDRFGLQKWSERNVLVGATQLEDQILDTITRLDLDDPEGRKLADGFVVDAKDRAGAFLKARRGSMIHLATTLDRDEADPLLALSYHAETLGIPMAVVDAILDAWGQLLDRHGIHQLAVEQAVVDDRWGLAGHLDRVVQLEMDLYFGPHIIPAGTVCVLDLKTGRLVMDQGHPTYWHNYAVQIASYSHSVPYLINGLDEHREPWPWPIDQRHALIAHLDLGNALVEGVATAQLFHVDLVEGHRAGNLCRQARDWQRSRSVFAAHNTAPVATTVSTTSEPF